MSRFKTTKLREGVYAIEGSRLIVSKDEAPRFRCPQEWSISPEAEPERILLTGTSRADALDRLQALLRLMGEA